MASRAAERSELVETAGEEGSTSKPEEEPFLARAMPSNLLEPTAGSGDDRIEVPLGRISTGGKEDRPDHPAWRDPERPTDHTAIVPEESRQEDIEEVVSARLAPRVLCPIALGGACARARERRRRECITKPRAWRDGRFEAEANGQTRS